MMCGGFTVTQPATADTQASAHQVKSQLEEKENRKFSVFKPVSYRSQVVAGTNYVIKIDVGDDEFLHLRAFQSLPHQNKPPTFYAYQTKKTKHDEIGYF